MRTETTVLTTDGAWCWFQDPRAIRNRGDFDRTYVGWITRAGDVEVQSYDHDTGERVRTTLHRRFEEDDHDAPALHVAPDGRIQVYYSRHAGENIRYRETARPEDVGDFGPEQAISPSAIHTYPNPVRLADEDRLYLFYRDENRNLAYVASDDGGETWGDARELIVTNGWLERGWVYFKIAGNGENRVDIAVSLCFPSSRGNDYEDVRHAWFADETLFDADGVELAAADGGTLPLQFEDVPPVVDSAQTWTDPWVWDCTAGEEPTIGYVEFHQPDGIRYRLARFEDGEWRDAKVTAGGSAINDRSPTYAGGIALDPTDPSACYVSVGGADRSQVQRWTTDDWETWSREAVSGSTVQNIRPIVPEDRHPDVPVVWMQGTYDHFADRGYDTGIVTRPLRRDGG